MLAILTNLLLISALVEPNTMDRQTDAVEIFFCDFSDADWDVNFDRWPDKWLRTYGPEMPQFIEAKLQGDSSTPEGKCLTVNLNGGGASISSPPIAVSDNFAYVAEVRLRGEGVGFARARVRVDFCDDHRQVVESARSKWYQNTTGWEKIQIGPVNNAHENVSLAIITLEVVKGKHVDLAGTFSLDDVWLARLPRMSVNTNSPFNVYDNPKKVVVTCELSGIREQDPDIHFELLDASSHKLEGNTVQLEGQLITEKLSKASDIVDARFERPAGYAGTTKWQPPIKDFGFYRVRVSMQTARGTLKDHMITIAVVPPMESAAQGEFGWSLAGDDLPLGFDQLNLLLPRTGISWVKLPVWYGESEPERGDQLMLFAEQLAAKKIEIVGVLDRPPADLDFGKILPTDLSVADLFSNMEASIWLPSLDEVLTRLSLKVKYWQLGIDSDTSYAHYPLAEREVSQLREKLFRFGQDVHLGIGWPWLQGIASRSEVPWHFQQMSASPQLTGDELASYLEMPAQKGVVRWSLVEPLPRKDYDLETRTRDLVQQMISGKIHGASAIFAAKPFDDDAGLMTDAGTPGDLLLPWRTTASLLSGTRYVGSIQLPGGSTNRLFEDKEGTMVMVVWNQQPRQESVFLGENVQVVDVWGRREVPKGKEYLQVIEVNTMPKYVVGINGAVARMMMGTSFANSDVPSIFELAHSNQLLIENSFAQGIGGVARIVAPEGWQILPDRIDLKLAVGEKAKRAFQVVLPFDATSGVTPLRVDFEIAAEKPYKFSVFRELNVGDKDIDVEVATRVEEDGSLIVEQRMINRESAPIDFKCLMYAPDRRRQRMHVFQLTNNWDLKTFTYTEAEDLIGKELLLKVEEIGGKNRVLNYRFMVEE